MHTLRSTRPLSCLVRRYDETSCHSKTWCLGDTSCPMIPCGHCSSARRNSKNFFHCFGVRRISSSIELPHWAPGLSEPESVGDPAASEMVSSTRIKRGSVNDTHSLNFHLCIAVGYNDSRDKAIPQGSLHDKLHILRSIVRQKHCNAGFASKSGRCWY